MSKEQVRKMLERTITSTPTESRSKAPSPVPSTNAGSSSGDEAANGLDIDGNIIQFEDAPLSEFIESMAKLIQKNFDIDDTVKGNVTLLANEPISREMAYPLLESILQSRGFTLVPTLDGQLIRVIQARHAPSSDIKVGAGGDPNDIEGYERFQTQLVPILYGDAGEISQVMTSLINQEDGRADVYAPTNTLIITTTATNLRRLLDIIHQIDVPGFEQRIEIVTLEYADSTEMSTIIQEVFADQAGSASRKSSRTTPSIRQIRTTTSRSRSTPSKPSSIIGAEADMRIVPDPRTNSLVIVATKGMIEQIKALITQLDSSRSWEENNMHVYPLLNAEVTEIADILNQLVSGAQPRRGATQSRAQQAAQIQPFEREVNIVAYEPNNSLLIMADPEDYKVLESIVVNLDVRQRQVFVEALILEVTIDDGYKVAVDMAALHENDVVAGSAFGGFATVANVLSAGSVGLPDGGLVGVLDKSNGVTITTEPVTDGEGNVVVPGQSATIPAVPAVLTALQTVTDVNVLSAPHLLTTDNVESSIVVGQEVPFVSGTSRSLDQSAYQSTLFNSIQREDVGITLKVTPQISEGEYVRLEITVENSSIGEPPPGQTVDLVGPTVNRAEVTNTIVISDGHTAIIGGLMSNNSSTGKSKVPFLGDIPILGFLFRGLNQRNIKRNMVVMLTPTIIKSDKELGEITEKRNAMYEKTKNEGFDASNYLKKVFKKERRK